MALSYKRWSEQDDKLRNLFPDGEYMAVIEAITEKLTAPGRFDKNGKPIPQIKMIELDLIIADQEGRERKMKDWVMLEGDMSWKFRHLCDACGKIEQYDADAVELHELVKKIPVVLIKSRKMKDQNGNDITRNTVADYLKPVAQKTASNDFIDDDIPL